MALRGDEGLYPPDVLARFQRGEGDVAEVRTYFRLTSADAEKVDAFGDGEWEDRWTFELVNHAIHEGRWVYMRGRYRWRWEERRLGLASVVESDREFEFYDEARLDLVRYIRSLANPNYSDTADMFESESYYNRWLEPDDDDNEDAIAPNAPVRYNGLMDTNDLLSTAVAADRLRERFPTANRSTVARWCERGVIKGYRAGPGCRWHVPAKEIDRLIQGAVTPDDL